MKKIFELILVLILIAGCQAPQDRTILIADRQTSMPIILDENADSLICWAANDLASDIENITGSKPEILFSSTVQNTRGIYIGEFNDPLIEALNLDQSSMLNGTWEKFHINIYEDNLIIAGSDIRGTIYGIFEVAERLGVSPWKWWSDVSPTSRKSLKLKLESAGITEEPSVQYRGIFLNDEDWGLQPWAAKTFEPETGDIGPKTYEKIFQLLLRLKANAIWPAMHPCTEGFYQIPGNNEMAKKYHIVVGTSHCEPMLRNNVDEWKSEKFGDFNYFSNEKSVCNYWQTRIDEVSDAENIITLGMRGVHDGRMQGGANMEEKKNMLEKIIDTQRSMLQNTKQKSLDSISQTIVLYKEVLDVYNMGLKVPEDVTLMWCDDNHGYIRRLSNDQELERSGGSGIYYHLSYWGSPHDYLWLSTTQPALIWYEMHKAYENGAQKIWIANVGDIKPAEYNMEFFLDMAWDISATSNTTIDDHMKEWATREFGTNISGDIVDLMNEYYRLASIRRPEFMAWNGVEPHTPARPSEFNSRVNGNEVERRILQYKNLFAKSDKLKNKVPKEKADAWFQLIEYPVKSAALMNYKFLYAQMAGETTDPLLREKYLALSSSAYKQIKELTSYYNEEMRSGKWKHMMSMAPRNINVFQMPSWPAAAPESTSKTAETENQKQRIFIQANEFITKKECEGYTWQSIEGLGYSNNAVTLFPFTIHPFQNDELPYIEYVFNAEDKGAFELQIRCLPTHSNNFDHQISVQIDEGERIPYSINTKGRSSAWKENVLRNHQIVKHTSTLAKSGRHTLRLYVNQTGIVVDQLAIDFSMDEKFYEIPVE